jgi:hypothetical protein
MRRFADVSEEHCLYLQGGRNVKNANEQTVTSHTENGGSM